MSNSAAPAAAGRRPGSIAGPDVRALGQPASDTLLLGVSRPIVVLRLLCPHLATWKGPLVVLGETGTGKGVLVDEIRRHLPEAMPFVRIALTAARHSLLYSNLFGFLKGHFTGAERDYDGLLAALSGGWLFLDDLQDLGEEFQLYLVDIADGKPFWPLGAERPVTPDFRIIVGTQRPLERLWRAKKLREDLFERLNGVTATLPPLAERLEDIPILAASLLARLAAALKRPVPVISDATLALFQKHRWPRNVRELERTLERAAFLAYIESGTEPLIEVRHLEDAPFPRLAGRNRGRRAQIPVSLVLGAVNKLGSATAAAEVLGVTPRTVQRQIRQTKDRSDADLA